MNYLFFHERREDWEKEGVRRGKRPGKQLWIEEGSKSRSFCGKHALAGGGEGEQRGKNIL